MSEYIVDMRQVSVDRHTRKNILTVDRFTLTRGELAAAVGPNGAGKSSLLQTINLLLAYQGDMRLFGMDTRHADKTLLRRRSSMVFQDMLLLHDSVYNNIAYPLRFRSISSSEIKQRVKQVLTELHCEHLAVRSAHLLSGGETQRVCIARALVTDPELLLLDEPFASLDAASRREMLEEIRQLAENKGITVLMVSHNFSDVLHFAKRAVAIFDGKIVQDDKPEGLLRRPVNEQVARLVGMDNIMPCSIVEGVQGEVARLAGNIQFPLPQKINKPVSLCCLPGDAFCMYHEHFQDQQQGWVVLEGLVERITPEIGSYRLQVQCGKQRFIVRIPRNQLPKDISGQFVLTFAFQPEEAHLL